MNRGRKWVNEGSQHRLARPPFQPDANQTPDGTRQAAVLQFPPVRLPESVPVSASPPSLFLQGR